MHSSFISLKCTILCVEMHIKYYLLKMILPFKLLSFLFFKLANIVVESLMILWKPRGANIKINLFNETEFSF